MRAKKFFLPFSYALVIELSIVALILAFFFPRNCSAIPPYLQLYRWPLFVQPIVFVDYMQFLLARHQAKLLY